MKTKALISFAVTAKLICAFVFRMQKAGFLMTRLKFFNDVAMCDLVHDVETVFHL